VRVRTKTSTVVTAQDCSPIPLAGPEDDAWLRKLALAANPADMLLRMDGAQADDEPVVSLDARSGTWWAGRYVGEVQFEGRRLRLEPRFGMPVLLRWLSVIWGIRIVGSAAGYEAQQIWLWHLIAHLWAGRLVVAGKHGVPFRRINTVHYGRALRGRLQVPQTALIRATGDERLASTSRERVVDPIISDILLAAFGRLRDALGSRAERNYWLPERARALLDDLHAARGARREVIGIARPEGIRYSPITENYRPVVNLSLSILAQRPRIPKTGADGKALGVLLDVAEIWELYVAKLLQTGLPGLHVSHTGRTTEHFRWLLQSPTRQKLGSLRPDVIIADHRGRHLAVADAKYKSTRVGQDRLTGVVTADLYQLAAYLSGFGDPVSHLHGFLIYPADDAGQVTERLSFGNPWTLSSATQRSLWFLAVPTESGGQPHTFTESEQQITELIHNTVAASP
jgi:5-methylcytosine-specific restriction enzyme subunit McrC